MNKYQNANCKVWDANDASHVSKSRPIDLKRKELSEVSLTPREKAAANLRRKRKGL